MKRIIEKAPERLNRLNQWMADDRRVVEGAWVLSKGNELQYRRRGAQEEILLRGELAGAKPLGLNVRLLEASSGSDVQRRFLTLQGRWQVDSDNRLRFLMERESGRKEVLTLGGNWQIGPGRELSYRVDQEKPRRGTKKQVLLRFQGDWEIGPDRWLTYVVDRAEGSSFRLRGTFQTGTVLARHGRIRYQLGAEVKGRAGRVKLLTFFGKWKVSRDFALHFEIPSSDGRIRSLDFKGAYSLGPRGQIIGRLMTRAGEPLGLEVVFTRSLLGGEAFVRLRKVAGEAALEGGVRVRW